jgi:hypothetical protein
MEIRNRQQNLGFGALFVKIKAPKVLTAQDKIDLYKMKHRIEDCFFKAGADVKALTGKFQGFSSCTDGTNTVYKFDEGSEKVEKRLKPIIERVLKRGGSSIVSSVKLVNENVKEEWLKWADSL